MNYLTDAFKALDVLNEDTFSSDEKGIEELGDFLKKDDGDIDITIIDDEAETEEDLSDSYIGKVILCCNVCKSNIYKDKEDVHIDEECNCANTDEECPYCHTVDGFMVVGEVAPFEEAEVEADDDVEVKVDGKEVEVKEKEEVEEDEEIEEESLTEAKKSKLNELFGKNKEIYVALLETGSSGRDVLAYGNKQNDKKEFAILNACKKYYEEANSSNTYFIKSYGTNGYKDLQKMTNDKNPLEHAKSVDELLRDSKFLKWCKENYINLNESLDDIDAIRDDKVERAKRRFTRVRDDADSRRDYMKKHDMKECGDMKNEACSHKMKNKKKLKEDYDEDEEVTVGIQTDNSEVFDRAYEIRDYFKSKGLKMSNEFGDMDYGFEFDVTGKPRDLFFAIVNKFPGYNSNSVEEFIDEYRVDDKSKYSVYKVSNKDESLKEDFSEVEVKTAGEEKQTIKVTSKPVEDEETIEPISSETEEEIIANSEEEPTEEESTEEEAEFEVNEVENESLNTLCGKFLKENYHNVKSFKVSDVARDNKRLKVEGIIEFTSGNKKKTSFLFEAKEATKRGNVKFIGENLQITRGKKAFSLIGKINNNTLLGESLSYNYQVKDSRGKSKRVSGTISNKRG